MKETTSYKYRGCDYLQISRKCGKADVRALAASEPDKNKKDIIFVHGLGGTWSVWGHQMSRMSSKYNVYSLDLPWSGREEITFDSIGQLVEWFGNALEIVPPVGSGRVLVAHSFGASITALHMSRHPDYVEAAILCSPFWKHTLDSSLSWDDFQRFIDNYKYFIRASLRHSSERVIDEDVLSIMAKKALQSSRPHSLLRFFDFLFAIPTVDFSRIKAKPLLIVGTEDTAVNPDCARHLQQLMVGSRLVTYEKAGHFPMHESAERFHADMLDYLENDKHA